MINRRTVVNRTARVFHQNVRVLACSQSPAHRGLSRSDRNASVNCDGDATDSTGRCCRTWPYDARNPDTNRVYNDDDETQGAYIVPRCRSRSLHASPLN